MELLKCQVQAGLDVPPSGMDVTRNPQGHQSRIGIQRVERLRLDVGLGDEEDPPPVPCRTFRQLLQPPHQGLTPQTVVIGLPRPIGHRAPEEEQPSSLRPDQDPVRTALQGLVGKPSVCPPEETELRPEVEDVALPVRRVEGSWRGRPVHPDPADALLQDVGHGDPRLAPALEPQQHGGGDEPGRSSPEAGLPLPGIVLDPLLPTEPPVGRPEAAVAPFELQAVGRCVEVMRKRPDLLEVGTLQDLATELPQPPDGLESVTLLET